MYFPSTLRKGQLSITKRLSFGNSTPLCAPVCSININETTTSDVLDIGIKMELGVGIF